MDKPGKLVVMNKTDYINMIKETIEEMDTEVIKKDPLNKLIKA